MTSHRRNFVEGGAFFFTVNLMDRRQRLLIEHIDRLRRAFREVRQRHPFAIEAIVILPDHLHVVWTPPAGDRDLSFRWRLAQVKMSERTVDTSPNCGNESAAPVLSLVRTARRIFEGAVFVRIDETAARKAA